MYPKIYEHSRIPVLLSRFAPIRIAAISFGLWVWCRGECDERLRTHETIHYLQQRELAFVGQWALYAAFWLRGLVMYRSAFRAYRENPFEREAYAHDADPAYLTARPRWAWLSHL